MQKLRSQLSHTTAIIAAAPLLHMILPSEQWPEHIQRLVSGH